MNKSELRQKFQFAPEYAINAATTLFGGKYKTERGAINRLKAINEHAKKECEQPDVKELSCFIRWTDNNNPIMHALVTIGDTMYKYNTGAGGWGYDKGSTVLANVFNEFCKGMLYRAMRKRNCPYGIHMEKGNYHFEGGVGIDCYYDIAKFLGFKVSADRTQKKYDYFRFYK